MLVVIGVILSVGAYPYEHPTAFGGLAKLSMTKTTAGLALRSTDRATPLIVLGLAALLGMGTTAFVARFSKKGVLAAALILLLVIAADAPAFAGRAVVAQFTQPAKLPSYVTEAANYLNSVHPGTRVYGLRAENSAAYRWATPLIPCGPRCCTGRM